MGVVEWFDAEAVSGHKQALPLAIPHRKGKHTVQMINTIFTPGMEGLEDHLGIATGEKVIPKPLQGRSELLVVDSQAA